jgi:hypothetical protein
MRVEGRLFGNRKRSSRRRVGGQERIMEEQICSKFIIYMDENVIMTPIILYNKNVKKNQTYPYTSISLRKIL